MSQNLVIVDYGSGNLRSVAKACEFAAGRAALDLTVRVTESPAEVLAADRVILPGVGAFGDCRKGLEAHAGLRDAVTEAALTARKPFMGICVGMQLLADVGHEHGDHDGLGWIPGEVNKLTAAPGLKIPHMGWNRLCLTAAGTAHPVLHGIAADDQVYFVHSYAFFPQQAEHVLATTDYGQTITAAIGRDNLVATQFHPEKSQTVGLRVIENFLTWNPQL